MNKNNFKILIQTKKFILGLESMLITFPKKDILTRDRMYNDSLLLMENIIKANFETDKRIKKSYQIDALTKVYLLDFYLERAYSLKYIGEKTLKIKALELESLNKMIYTWINNGSKV